MDYAQEISSDLGLDLDLLGGPECVFYSVNYTILKELTTNYIILSCNKLLRSKDSMTINAHLYFA